MKKSDKNIIATLANILFYDNKIWFTEKNCNELYYYDCETRKTVFFCKFNEEKEYETYLFSEIILYKKELLVIPAAASSLYRVNIGNKKIKKILLKIDEQNFGRNIAKFVSAQIWNEKLYLIGAAYPLIVEYNCKNGEIIYISEGLDYMRKGNIHNGSIFVRKTLLLDEKIYIPLCRKNYVGIFDIKTQKISYEQVGSDRCSYSSICGKDGEHFWLAPAGKGPVVYWEKSKRKWKELDFPEGCNPLWRSFSDIALWRKNVWLFPFNAKGIWKIDCNKNQIRLFSKISDRSNMTNIFCQDKRIFCFSEKENKLFIIEGDSENVKIVQILLPNERIKYHQYNDYEEKITFWFYEKKVYDKKKLFISEDNITKLKNYIFWIKKRKVNNTKMDTVRPIGKDIFSIITGE